MRDQAGIDRVSRVVPGGIRLRLKVQPKARREGVTGLAPDPDGSDSTGWALKLSVGAPPEDGKANAAVIALLAEKLGVAKSAISVVSGATDRHSPRMWLKRPAMTTVRARCPLT